jgi:hypothetical protein
MFGSVAAHTMDSTRTINTDCRLLAHDLRDTHFLRKHGNNDSDGLVKP